MVRPRLVFFLLFSSALLLVYLIRIYSRPVEPEVTCIQLTREDAESAYLKSHSNDSDPDAFEYFKSSPIELEGKVYSGLWTALELPSLQEEEGRVYMETSDIKGSWPRRYRSRLRLYDGLWENDPVLELVVSGAVFDYETRCLNMGNATGSLRLNALTEYWTLMGSLQYQKTTASGVLHASNGTWELSLDLEELTIAVCVRQAEMEPRTMYSLVVSVICAAQVFAFAKHAHDCSVADSVAKKVKSSADV